MTHPHFIIFLRRLLVLCGSVLLHFRKISDFCLFPNNLNNYLYSKIRHIKKHYYEDGFWARQKPCYSILPNQKENDCRFLFCILNPFNTRPDFGSYWKKSGMLCNTPLKKARQKTLGQTGTKLYPLLSPVQILVTQPLKHYTEHWIRKLGTLCTI